MFSIVLGVKFMAICLRSTPEMKYSHSTSADAAPATYDVGLIHASPPIGAY